MIVFTTTVLLSGALGRTWAWPLLVPLWVLFAYFLYGSMTQVAPAPGLPS